MAKLKDKKIWFDACQVKPSQREHYALCHLDVGRKIIPGWWTGTGWDGLNYKGQPVERWMYSE
jgi:hypothetical protein